MVTHNCCEDTANRCGVFVNKFEIHPPLVGHDCPYYLDLSNVFQGEEPAPAAPECEQLVIRAIMCPQTMIELRDKLLIYFPLTV